MESIKGNERQVMRLTHTSGLNTGDDIKIGSEYYKVTSVENDTTATVKKLNWIQRIMLFIKRKILNLWNH